jgi:hypothetical protein
MAVLSAIRLNIGEIFELVNGRVEKAGAAPRLVSGKRSVQHRHRVKGTTQAAREGGQGHRGMRFIRMMTQGRTKKGGGIPAFFFSGAISLLTPQTITLWKNPKVPAHMHSR